MKIRSLYLKNFQSYDDEYILFPEGTTFISGNIGTGKSTILRGIFAGLFQNNAKNVMPDIESLDELVQFGKDEAFIEIVFEIGGENYTIEWKLGTDGSGDSRSAYTRSCKITSSSLKRDITGVRDVQEAIENDIICMDADSFVNSVYVQQKELQRLLNADKSTRKKILDGLLGLDSIDGYIDRMKNARPAATRLRDDAEAKESELEQQIQNKPEKKELNSDIKDLKKGISSFENSKEDFTEKLEHLKDEKSSVDKKIEEYEELKELLETKKEELSEKKQQLKDTKSKKTEHTKTLSNLEDEVNDLKEKYEDVSESEKEKLEENIRDTDKVLTQKQSELKNKKERLEEIDIPEVTSEDISEKQKKIDELKEEVPDESIDKIIEDLRDEKEELSNKLSAIKAEYKSKIKNTKSRIKEYGQIQENGICPMCNQEVPEDHNHDKSDIKEDLKLLKEEREQKVAELNEKIVDLNTGITQSKKTKQKVEKIEILGDKLESMEDEFEQKTDLIEKKEHLITNIEDLEDIITDKEDTLEDLEKQKESIKQHFEWKNQIETKEREIESLKKDIKWFDEDISRITKEKQKLLKEIKNLQTDVNFDELKEKSQNFERYINVMNDKIESVVDEITRKREKIADLKSTLKQIEELEERKQEVIKQKNWAHDIRGETETMIEVYDRVKDEMRKENIALLNKYTNEIFTELYKDENFSRIDIGDEYEIRMIRSSGHTMKPNLASGGESAILNLALRAAVYRLVSEKESRIGQLPPFILDEPTQGMDTNHIRQLENLIYKIREWDVSQIFMVSHQGILTDVAENEISVTIDGSEGNSSTEISTGI